MSILQTIKQQPYQLPEEYAFEPHMLEVAQRGGGLHADRLRGLIVAYDDLREKVRRYEAQEIAARGGLPPCA